MLRNIGQGKPAFQVSEAPDADHYLSEFAVDGSPRARPPSGSCTHSVAGAHNHPWWAVDLGSIGRVTGVSLLNRVDGSRK